nr:unnamed protein product [Callosobruchus analis]
MNVNILTPTEITIPNSTTLTFDGTTYRIFLSTDSNNCTHCQQPGHPHIRCPNRTSTTEEHISVNVEDQSTSTAQPTDTQETSATQLVEQDIQEAAEDSTPPPAPKPVDQDPHTRANPQTKRQLSISPEVIEFSQPTSQTKKKKTTVDTEHLLEAASQFISSPQDTLKLNKTELADFIDNAQKSKDIIATSKNYTQDLPELSRAMAADTDIVPSYGDKNCEICCESSRKSCVRCEGDNCTVVLHVKCFETIAKVFFVEKRNWKCKNCTVKSKTTNETTLSDVAVMSHEIQCLNREKQLLIALNDEMKS